MRGRSKSHNGGAARNRQARVVAILALALATLAGCGNSKPQSVEERAREGLVPYQGIEHYSLFGCTGIGNNEWMCTVENDSDGKRTRLRFGVVSGNPGLTLRDDPAKLPG